MELKQRLPKQVKYTLVCQCSHLGALLERQKWPRNVHDVFYVPSCEGEKGQTRSKYRVMAGLRAKRPDKAVYVPPGARGQANKLPSVSNCCQEKIEQAGEQVMCFLPPESSTTEFVSNVGALMPCEVISSTPPPNRRVLRPENTCHNTAPPATRRAMSAVKSRAQTQDSNIRELEEAVSCATQEKVNFSSCSRSSRRTRTRRKSQKGAEESMSKEVLDSKSQRGIANSDETALSGNELLREIRTTPERSVISTVVEMLLPRNDGNVVLEVDSKTESFCAEGLLLLAKTVEEFEGLSIKNETSISEEQCADDQVHVEQETSSNLRLHQAHSGGSLSPLAVTRKFDGDEENNAGQQVPMEDISNSCLTTNYDTPPAEQEALALNPNFLAWLTKRLQEEGMDSVIAVYALGLLEADVAAGESPDEKREALVDFIEAMVGVSDNGGLCTPTQSAALIAGEIWERWQDRELEGAGSSPQQGDASCQYDPWLVSQISRLGLDEHVFVPYIQGLLDSEEEEAALYSTIAQFLEDVTAGIDDSCRVDPAGLAAEIVARRGVRSREEVGTSGVHDELGVEDAGHGKHRRKTKATISNDLFSHWWGSTLHTSYKESLEDGGNTDCRPGAWDEEAKSVERGASPYSSGLPCGTQRSSAWEFEETWRYSRGQPSASGHRSLEHVQKPVTSAVVARRMILHVLGLRDKKRTLLKK